MQTASITRLKPGITSVGKGNITPLQKPKKPHGPASNIRPLTLSNCSRKLLSMITLKRIQSKLDDYTGPTQCAYKRGRSCGDIIWSQRILISVVLKKEWSYHRMSIDMSSAFDTINRQTVLNARFPPFSEHFCQFREKHAMNSKIKYIMLISSLKRI